MAEYAPQEFSPELSQDFLDNLTRPIEKRGAEDEGRAYSEAASRGLSGQAFAGSLVGAAREGTADRKSRAVSDFNYNLANMTREERLRDQGREWELADQQFAAAEAEKARAFQARLAEMGYAARREESDKEFKSSIISSFAGAGGQAAGMYLGGLGRKPGVG